MIRIETKTTTWGIQMICSSKREDACRSLANPIRHGRRSVKLRHALAATLLHHSRSMTSSIYDIFLTDLPGTSALLPPLQKFAGRCRVYREKKATGSQVLPLSGQVVTSATVTFSQFETAVLSLSHSQH